MSDISIGTTESIASARRVADKYFRAPEARDRRTGGPARRRDDHHPVVPSRARWSRGSSSRARCWTCGSTPIRSPTPTSASRS